MVEEREANKSNGRTVNSDTLLFWKLDSFRKEQMINAIECRKSQNKTFLSGEKVLISDYL